MLRDNHPSDGYTGGLDGIGFSKSRATRQQMEGIYAGFAKAVSGRGSAVEINALLSEITRKCE